MIPSMDNIIAFLFVFCVLVPALYALAVLITAAMIVILVVAAIVFVVALCYSALRGGDAAGTAGGL